MCVCVCRVRAFARLLVYVGMYATLTDTCSCTAPCLRHERDGMAAVTLERRARFVLQLLFSSLLVPSGSDMIARSVSMTHSCLLCPYIAFNFFRTVLYLSPGLNAEQSTQHAHCVRIGSHLRLPLRLVLACHAACYNSGRIRVHFAGRGQLPFYRQRGLCHWSVDKPGHGLSVRQAQIPWLKYRYPHERVQRLPCTTKLQ